MKLHQKSLLQIGLMLIVSSITFTSCVKTGCEREYNYVAYRPMYMSYEDLRSAVAVEGPRKMESTGKIYYYAPYLFVNEINEGIHIVDISNVSAPVITGFINIPGNVDIAMSGTTLYADSYIDLVALDVSNMNAITIVDREQNVFPYRVDENIHVDVDETKGVVDGWVGTDTVITMECGSMDSYFFPTDVVFLSESSAAFEGAPGVNGSKGGSMARFTVDNNYLYCLSENTMELFNVTNQNNPVHSGDVPMPLNIETIFPHEDYLFIGSTTGVSIYNNSSPFNPTFVSIFEHATSCDPVVVKGNYAYSTLRSGNQCAGFSNQLDIIDISNISYPTLVNTVNLTNPRGLGIDEDYLFICDGNGGLRMYSINVPTSPTLLQVVDIEESFDVITANGLLIVVTADGYHLFDYSSGNLNEVGAIKK